jgi:3-carboxy-cis,cis-muconate cycloisomerase
MGLYERLFGDGPVAEQLSDRARLQAMLDVELALAEAEAGLGIVPASCVAPIRSAARAELYDVAALGEEAASAGNLAIPLVRQLTQRVAAADEVASRYVHWGATSQDVIDTALVLQLRAAVPLVAGQLARGADAAAEHAQRHAAAPMPGRTWLQQATPITFGLKAAGWTELLDRARGRLEAALGEALVLQLGGSSGTLAALGDRGLALAEALGARLQLRVPDAPWHAQRDRIAHLACALGVCAGSSGKIARDLGLLAQTEVGEARPAERQGQGGSSTMPQKHNPVAAAVALAAATRAPGLVATLLAAMPQEHERGLGGWQAEWPVLPELVLVAAGGARAVADALTDLVVDVERMRLHVEESRGVGCAELVALALTPSVGRREAHARVEAGCRRALAEKRALAEVLAEDPVVARHLAPEELRRCTAPENALGSATALVQRILSRRTASRKGDA